MSPFGLGAPCMAMLLLAGQFRYILKLFYTATRILLEDLKILDKLHRVIIGVYIPNSDSNVHCLGLPYGAVDVQISIFGVEEYFNWVLF